MARASTQTLPVLQALLFHILYLEFFKSNFYVFKALHKQARIYQISECARVNLFLDRK